MSRPSSTAFTSRLTSRDRQILQILDDHQILTTDQIRRLWFTSLRTCQLRLDVLRGLGLLERFRWARVGGGSEQWKWVLGWHGARLQAAGAARPAPTERAHRDLVLRLSMRPDLGHLLCVNEFFVRLQQATRAAHGPDGGAGAGLLRWWPEHVTTARFSGVHPDGHGIWTTSTRAEPQAVGFFLECDLGTEALPRLVAKLDGYARLSVTGPRYPVLFWLPNPRREQNLQDLLRRNRDPRHRAVTVATATHDADPAGPVWLPVTGIRRVPLTVLPSDHGDRSATNPNWRDGVLDLSDQGHHLHRS